MGALFSEGVGLAVALGCLTIPTGAFPLWVTGIAVVAVLVGLLRVMRRMWAGS